LLACVNCNSTKKDRPVDRALLLLPDQDNTFLAFEYNAAGQIFPRGDLTSELRLKAERLLHLTGLDKYPDEIAADDLAEAALERWQQRRRAWKEAEGFRAKVLQRQSEDMHQESITALALATGFFSVWMAVFADIPSYPAAFVRAFPGTSLDCFDEFGRPAPRPGGQV